MVQLCPDKPGRLRESKMLSKTKAKLVLKDRMEPGQVHEVNANEPEACRRLLALILAQALEDGMCRIAVGADEVAGKTHLRYFGPRDSDSPRWWDMTSISAEDYSLFVQAILSATSLERTLLPRGAFLADLCGHEVRVLVAIRTWFDIELELAEKP
jgi:hypothetical protein